MSESLAVDPEALVTSAPRLTSIRRTSSPPTPLQMSGRFVAVQLDGPIAGCDDAKAAKWAAMTNAFAVRLYEHGEGYEPPV